ncbi:hypothetical protein QFZ82_000787 [Streptomyces sp. V4I23]|nr:hypothetical protein [Streptomyces sp. V4I23]
MSAADKSRGNEQQLRRQAREIEQAGGREERPPRDLDPLV